MPLRLLAVFVCLVTSHLAYALGQAHFTWDEADVVGDEIVNLAQPANSGTLRGGARIGPGVEEGGALVLDGL